MSAHDRTPDEGTERDALAAGREALRQVREAGRDAVREARRVAREGNRQARESVLETMRSARAQTRSDDTRSRIQRVGLRLFTERGYEATSLREIAEELGVTKAALYYHFHSKDEIIKSLVDERVARVDEIIDWAEDQPRDATTRREVLRRYSQMLNEPQHQALMQFAERNQSSMAQHPAGAAMRDQITHLLDLFIDADAPLTDQIRNSMAIFVLHAAFFALRERNIDDRARNEAALQVALEMVTAPGASPAG
jgi:AcrR family transcriptional regulator